MSRSETARVFIQTFSIVLALLRYGNEWLTAHQPSVGAGPVLPLPTSQGLHRDSTGTAYLPGDPKALPASQGTSPVLSNRVTQSKGVLGL